MTSVEGADIRPGDSVYVLDQTNKDWPQIYNVLLGKTVEVIQVVEKGVHVMHPSEGRIVLYWNEIERDISCEIEEVPKEGNGNINLLFDMYGIQEVNA